MLDEVKFSIRIFIAYSRHDQSFLDDLLTHLNPFVASNTIEVFHGGVVENSHEWDADVKRQLRDSDIILPLLSTDFMAADYYSGNGLRDLLILHEKKAVQLIPVVVRPFTFGNSPFAKLNILPNKIRPISTFPEHEEGFRQVVQKLKEYIDIARERREIINRKKKEEIATFEQRQEMFADYCRQGEEAFARQDWEEARQNYIVALKLYLTKLRPFENAPSEKRKMCADNITAAEHLQSADAYEQRPAYDKALAELQAALRLKPQLSEQLTPRIAHLKTLVRAEKKVVREVTKEANHKTFDKLPAPIKQLQQNMLRIEGGTFLMGSDENEDSQPIHEVKVNDFYIGIYLVTQAQWRAFTGHSPSHFNSDPQCPVEQVSWKEIQLFLQNLNDTLGKQYRLPTEAEWEYAARGGLQSQGYLYSGSNNIDEVAWHAGNSKNKTHPVGSKKPNELGLYDMSGNVWEWCHDQWQYGYKEIPENNRASKSKAAASLRVMRGGCWDDHAEMCEVAYRNYLDANLKHGSFGFRLACSV